jgi:hypothetical protein
LLESQLLLLLVACLTGTGILVQGDAIIKGGNLLSPNGAYSLVFQVSLSLIADMIEGGGSKAEHGRHVLHCAYEAHQFLKMLRQCS